MKTNVFYTYNGRTAFDVILKNLKLKKSCHVLVPEYSCDVLFQNKKIRRVNYKFYETKNNFFFDLKKIKKRINKNTKVVLIINFFGIRQDTRELYDFCKKKKIFLIIDDCHTYYKDISFIKNKCDFAFFSPSKIFPKLSKIGLILNFNKSIFIKQKFQINIITYLDILKSLIKKVLNWEKNKFKKRRPLYEISNNLKSKFEIYHVKPLNYQIKKINLIKINYEKKIRIKNFEYWKKVCTSLKIRPVLSSNNIKHGCPLYFTAYVKDKKKKLMLFKYAWKNNIDVCSWPTFYEKQIKNKRLLDTWENTIFFPMEKKYYQLNLEWKI